jgi:exodeoxyribonuclease VII large subunit
MVLAESHQQLTQERRYFRSVCETQMLRQQGFLNLLSQSVCQTGVLRVQQAHQQIGQLPHTLLQAVNGRYQQELWRVNQSQHSVRRYAAWRLDHQYREKSALAHRLTVAVPFALKNAHQRMASLERSVHLVDPINVMGRGFAMIRRGDAVLTRSSQLVIGESLQIRFADGSAEAIINHTQSDTND